jgi:hypothetical protein
VRAYSAARVFSTLAHSLLGATFGWHVYDLTASSLWLGVLGLVEFLPKRSAAPVPTSVSCALTRRREPPFRTAPSRMWVAFSMRAASPLRSPRN